MEIAPEASQERVREPSPTQRMEEMEAVEAEEGEGIEDDINIKPKPEQTQKRKKWKGIRLSWLLNAAVLGLGYWAASKGWKEHVEQRSLQFLCGLAAGGWTGLSLMWRYKRTKRRKYRTNRMLNFNIGPKELDVLMKGIPPWIEFGNTEQAFSINKLIDRIWSFYDSAICKAIIEGVEPVMMQYKPVFVSNIKFKKLTFGKAPFAVTHVSVLKEDIEEMVLELGVRWNGELHVSVGVEVIGAGVITPAVKRLDFFANVRVALTRMKPIMPCFGAVLISFNSPPLVTFDLDCGPGIGELIEAWLIPFLKNDVLGNMLVWPNRIIVPLLPPSVLGPLDTLQLHTRGVLKVIVVEAKGLPKADIIGKGDPFAILETVPLNPSQTKVIHDTDCPKWNETMFLKVQEVDQCLRVTIRDQESAVVGALTMVTSQFQGRTMVPLEDLVSGQEEDRWYPLGKGDWGDFDGPGTGCGEIRLKLCYYSLNDLRSGKGYSETSDSTPRGLVFITVNEASNLMSVDNIGVSDPYCVVWLGHVKRKTRTLKNTRNPIWQEAMDWSNVSALDTLYVEVWDQGKISDQLLGKAKIALLPIAKEFSIGIQSTPIQFSLSLDNEQGDVTLTIEWVSLDCNPLPVNKQLLRNYQSLLNHSERGYLFVRLVSGQDLKNVDTFSLSDPYVIFKIGGNPKVSKYINNDLNPVWEESFQWSGVRETSVLHGEVKDKGTVKDMSLGTFKLPIISLLDPPGEVHSFTVDLKEKHTEKAVQGRINLQMCWKIWDRDNDEVEPQEPKWPNFVELGQAEVGSGSD